MARSPRTHEPGDEPPAAEPRRIDIVDAAGNPLGYSFTMKDEIPESDEPGPGETAATARLHHLAKALAGWSTFSVDGEKYGFSQARAVALFTRFPHIAAQVERTISKDDK